MPAEESIAILEKLGFTVSGEGDVLEASVPSWRSDVGGEADLIEDISRIKGFDHIPSVPLVNPDAVTRSAVSPERRRALSARRALAARGMNEAVTWSFTETRWAEMFGGGGEALRLDNPISAEADMMRPSLLPNLIVAAGRNVDRGFSEVALFEIGNVYRGTAPEEQNMVAGGLRRGRNASRHWSGAPRDIDVFDAKADAIAALAEAGAPPANLQTFNGGPDWYHPGRSGSLRLGPKTVLAEFGEVHPRVLSAFGVKGPMVAFEVFLENLPKSKAKASRNHSPLEASDLPSVDRDFAFVVASDTAAQDIVRAAIGAEKTLIDEVSVFDVFEGGALEEGQKSIAIRVRLQPTEKTLTDAEIEAVAGKIVANVAKVTGGKLRD
jgi:phenylalanyl-tRNA synthetase beta chain